MSTRRETSPPVAFDSSAANCMETMRGRAAVLLAGYGPVCSAHQSVLQPSGPAAAGIADLWWWMFFGALAVFAAMLFLLARALTVSRNYSERDIRVLIVVAGAIVPALLLGAMVAVGLTRQRNITLLEEEKPVVVEVLARQWSWQFCYQGEDARGIVLEDVLVIPRTRVVEFHLRSADVIHSFWIPRLGGKMDLIPGRTNRLRLRADQQQAGWGQCAEFCGREHARMRFAVHVLEPEAFDSWLLETARASIACPQPDPTMRRTA